MTGSPPEFRTSFAGLPLPATLVDRDGVILDVNDAFLEMARQQGVDLRREDRIGDGANPHLQRRPIINELCRVVADGLLLLAWRCGRRLRQGRVVLDEPIRVNSERLCIDQVL